MLKETQNLLTEISAHLRKIEEEHPELYKHLDENPITIPREKQPIVDNKVLENYLQTLKDVLKRYKKSLE